MSQSSLSSSEMILFKEQNVAAAIERFEVSTDMQDTAVEIARNTIRNLWCHDPDFVAALVLRGREHGGISTYVQWRKSASGTFPFAPTEARSLRKALVDYRLLDSRTYTIAFTRLASPNSGLTRISLAETPLIHFGIFRVTPQNQATLLERAEVEAPNSFATPGLLAIDFHRSADGQQVVNVGAWNSFDAFNKLHSQPGFKPGNQYFQGLADFTPDFFDLADVISHSARQTV